MSSGVSLSAGSLLGKQNLWALPADLKFSSRNVNRAATGSSLGSGKGFLVQNCWEWLPLPSLPPSLPAWWSLGWPVLFPSSVTPVVLSHTEIPGVISPHGVCWWSLSSEPVGHSYCPSKPYLGTFWSLLNLSYQFKLENVSLNKVI